MMKNSKNMNGFQKYLSKPDLFWCANHRTLEHTTGPLWQVHRKHISSSKNRNLYVFRRSWTRCSLSYKWNSCVREWFSRDWVWFGTLLSWDKRKDYFTLITVGNEHLRTCTPSKGNFSEIAQVVKHLINYAQTNLSLQPSLLLLVWWNSQCLGGFQSLTSPSQQSLLATLYTLV